MLDKGDLLTNASHRAVPEHRVSNHHRATASPDDPPHFELEQTRGKKYRPTAEKHKTNQQNTKDRLPNKEIPGHGKSHLLGLIAGSVATFLILQKNSASP
jgi:hypothetical protein